jgi:hypothetical protein
MTERKICQMGDKLPRICDVLGGEENPLKVGEEFDVDGDATGYHIDENGVMKWGRETAEVWVLCDAINHPEKIIRHPQFSDDEKALFKAFHALGYDYWFRQTDGYLWASMKKPTPGNGNFYVPAESKSHHLGKEFLPHLACGQMVDVAAYLESEEKI